MEKKSRSDVAKWRLAERPEKEPVYNNGKLKGYLLIFILNFACAWAYLLLAQDIIDGLPIFNYASGPGYNMGGNAIAYFVYFFMMVLPWMIGGVIHSKKQVPMYSFIAVGAWVIAGITFLRIDQFIGFYQAFAAGIIVLANLPSQKDWRVHNRDILYYILLGILVCYINTEIMVASGDVWVYIQFVHIYLFTVIAISLKMEKWCYFFMIGWALYALYSLLFMGDKYVLMGLYNLIAPAMLTGTALYYFYKIYKPNRYKMFVENPLQRKMVKSEDISKNK